MQGVKMFKRLILFFLIVILFIGLINGALFSVISSSEIYRTTKLIIHKMEVQTTDKIDSIRNAYTIEPLTSEGLTMSEIVHSIKNYELSNLNKSKEGS
jgi:predicted PurR-regulated permease PerM